MAPDSRSIHLTRDRHRVRHHMACCRLPPPPSPFSLLDLERCDPPHEPTTRLARATALCQVPSYTLITLAQLHKAVSHFTPQQPLLLLISQRGAQCLWELHTAEKLSPSNGHRLSHVWCTNRPAHSETVARSTTSADNIVTPRFRVHAVCCTCCPRSICIPLVMVGNTKTAVCVHGKAAGTSLCHYLRKPPLTCSIYRLSVKPRLTRCQDSSKINVSRLRTKCCTSMQ
jgi:hypothetical protein